MPEICVEFEAPKGTGPPRNPVKRMFVGSFIFACVLFWWLPSILIRLLGMGDPITAWAWRMSIGALGAFVVGFLSPRFSAGCSRIAPYTLNRCAEFAYSATKLVAIPAFFIAARFAVYRASLAYGEGTDIPLAFQAVLYTHMFFAYMFLGSLEDFIGQNRRKAFIAIGLVLFPRLIISLHWTRFFVGQTMVVILLMAFARGWLRLSAARIFQLCLVVGFIFFVPALTRGDRVFGEASDGSPQLISFIKGGSTLGFFQDYRNLHTECPPLLVSLTEKMIPYSALKICTIDVGGAKNTPSVLSSLLTRQDTNDLVTGTGSIYILELYLTGGVVGIILGSAIFGASCRWFVENLSSRSLFAGIWAECLVRALFAPRGNLGYVYERIPSLVFATLCVIAVCRTIDILQKPLRAAVYN
jgi:hypothetical protein